MSPAVPPAPSLDMPAWLLCPEHAERMGAALWVYLWLWRAAPAGDDPRYREVRAGGTWRTTEISEALGLQERSVRRHLAALCKAGYLVTYRAGQGLTGHLVLPGAAPAATMNADISDRAGDEDRTDLADQQARADNSGRSAGESGQICPIVHPPAPPIRVLEESFLGSCSSRGLSLVPTTAKTAQAVPDRQPRQAGPPKPVAVAAGGPRRLLQEQTIAHLISRIDDWERPDLNRTLLEALCAVPLDHLPAVFDQAWRFHRTRGYKDNPAGWWAATLRRCAEACIKAVGKGSQGYG